MTNDPIKRQLALRLRSLAAAGIDWLPRGEPPALMPAPPPAPPPAALPGFDEPAPPPAVDLPLEQRRIALAELAAEVRGCTRCPELCSSRTQTVFGDGGPGVELCFVGEAPGEDEDRQGLPFVGAAGQLLNKIIAACGLKREDVYIMNVLKCRPPRNRPPLPNEAANCRDYFDRQLDLVRPKFICAWAAPRRPTCCKPRCRSASCAGGSTIIAASRSWSPTIPPSCCRIAARRRSATCGKT